MNNELTDLDRLLAQDIDQRSDEWHSIRLGRFTASQMYRLMGTPKTAADKAIGLTQGGQTYVMEKVAETLTGVVPEGAETMATRWGVENEDAARELFQLTKGINVSISGFYPYYDHAGGSPDGLGFQDHSVIEIKCPFNSANHIEYGLIDTIETLKADHSDHYWQLVSNAVFTGRRNCWFVSYDPRMMDETKRLFTFQFTVPEEDVTLLKEKISNAVAYKLAILNKLNKS